MKNTLNYKGIATRIAFYTFAASIVWILVVAGSILYFEYRYSINNINNKVSEVGKTHSAGISQCLWDYDYQLLETQLKSLVQLPSIASARVTEPYGDMWEFGKKSDVNDQPMTFLLQHASKKETVRMGVLELTPDFKPSKDNLISMAWKTFTIQAFNSTAIAIFIFILFYFLAGRHLTDIAHQAGKLSSERLDSPIRLYRKSNIRGRNDELDILEAALNNMRINLIQAFSELRISEERHRKLFETMRLGVIYQEKSGKITAVNPAALEILGLNENQVLTGNHAQWDVIDEDGSPVPAKNHPGAVERNFFEPVVDEVRGIYNPLKKTYRWVRLNAVPLTKEGETEPYQVHLTFDDITKRRESRETLERYSHIISVTRDMMSFVDDHYVYQAVNDAYLIYHDKKREEIIGFSIPELMGTEQFESVVKSNFDRALNGETVNFQEWFEYPEVGRRYMNVTYNPFGKDTGRVSGVVVSVHDLTQLHVAEQAQRRISRMLRLIMDSIPARVFWKDREGVYQGGNQAFINDTGLASPKVLIGKTDYDFAPEDLAKKYRRDDVEVIMSGEPKLSFEEQQKRPDGKTYWLLTSKVPMLDEQKNIVGLLGTYQDISDRKKMEDILVQSEKMLSVGGLAAGMAHEINNPMAGMIQSANMMKSRLRDLDLKANRRAAQEIGVSMDHIKAFMENRGILKMLDAITESGNRVTDIIKNMLSFARKPDTIISTHYLDQLVDQALELSATDYDLKKQYDFKNITIIKKFDDNLPMVPCEGNKIQQVLLNILRNGAQAMQVHGTWDNNPPCFIIQLSVDKEANMIEVNIKDNGPGMDENIRKKIFEPFFTTKPVGEGVGLGLSVSYFIIVENHGGTMNVVSAPGKGTTFILRLPLKENE